MAYRTIEITLISANDLKDVNLFSKMEVYAVATISGDSRSKKRTPADKEGGKNPNWNATLKFNIPEYESSRLVLHIVLRTKRILGDRAIGEVHVPIRELLDGYHKAAAASSSATAGGDEKKRAPAAQFVSYQVRKPISGKAKGVLNLSYKFSDLVTVPTPPPPQIAVSPVTAYPPPSAQMSGEPFTAYPPPDMKGPKSNEPVTAYPAAGASTTYPAPGGYGYPPPPQAGYGYPPQSQAGYGYPSTAGYPPQPQAGYGYPPPQQQGGYGYPPPQQQGGYGYPPAGYGYGAQPPMVAQPAKKNKFGMGLGAGLLGGAIGGMLLGDMISDGGGYDAGYDDGFGF